MNQSFGRKEKLKSKIEITRLFTEGNSVKKYPLRLLYLPQKNNKLLSRAAVSVSKRNFKRAVDRSRIKRLMREAYRKNKYLVFSDLDISYDLMFIYTGRELPHYDKLFKVTELLLQEMNQREKIKEDEKKVL